MSVPHVVMPRQVIYGGKIETPLPLYTMDAIDSAYLKHHYQDYDKNRPLETDDLMWGMDQYATSGLEGFSGTGCGCNSVLAGLGAVQSPSNPSPAPQSINIQAREGIAPSTITAVIGIATVLIIGSVAVWAWSKAK